MSTVYNLYLRIFSFVWLGLTKVYQAASGRNHWLNPRKNEVEELETEHKLSRLPTWLGCFGFVQAGGYP